MNEYLSYIILGLTQGLTEFLPVSSSGHLLLLENMGIGDPSILNNLILHCATLIVVLIAYGKKLFALLRRPTCPQARFLLLATLPTALCAAAIRYFLPDPSYFLPFFFALNSFVLVLPRFFPPTTPLTSRSTAKALIVGLTQGLACFPGLSRSGSSSTALLFSGCPRKEVPEYSFLLSVPIVLGSSLIEVIGQGFDGFTPAVLPGALVAFISGLFALKFFSKTLEKQRLHLFSAYTLLMSVASFYLLFG